MSKRFIFLILLLALSFAGLSQEVPSPKSHFGFDIGEDYKLANFTQSEAYFKKVAEASDRVQLVSIGKTEYGREQPMMIVTSPANFEKLERYREISQTLARADLTKEEAEKLVMEGKPVVWIDGGLHANEVVGPHQLIETLYQLASNNDQETLEILDKVIILLVHANPDGMEIMSDWYMRKDNPKERDQNIPILYQKYVGHDNNRDFYMNNMSEATNMSLQQYVEWIPQIIYNHHQSGPAGTVVAGPPYRDPFNHVFDPLIITSLDAVGAAMINRMHQEDKAGYTRLSGSVFSTWWNGGLRTTPYYHNIIGILTEIIGNPTPSNVPLVPERLIPNNANPYPITPRDWHFQTSIDYSVSLNYAILNHAVRHGDELLRNIYLMGRKSIEKGNKDTWTMYPKNSQAIEDAFQAAKKDKEEEENGYGRRIPKEFYDSVYTDLERRDPRGYVLSADQPDFPTAIKFLNALIKSGIQVHQASEEFSVNGKTYPANSYVVKTAQAFRPHVIDMFEPQDHPNDFLYPGGPPIRPYDAAGWTLAFQMGVEVDRIMEEFDGPFTAVPYGTVQSPPAKSLADGSGYLLDARGNNSFMAVNDLLKSNVKVHRTTSASNGLPAGSFFVSDAGESQLEKASAEYGVYPTPVSSMPADAEEIQPARIALYDYYGGSMPSGWVRWMMEKFHFDYQLVFPQDINAGNLNDKYDVILFIGPGIPGPGQSRAGRSQPDKSEIDEDYHHMLGFFTKNESVPQLKSFLEAGGKILTVGSATDLAYHLNLPVKDALVELTEDGTSRPLSGEDYYIPGSVLEMHVDTSHPANYGMNEKANILFNRSPVFSLSPNAGNMGVKPIAWFGEEEPLKSGWAWGQHYLRNGVTAFEAKFGEGKFYAFGPEITFRAQSHGTFKLLFNGLYK